MGGPEPAASGSMTPAQWLDHTRSSMAVVRSVLVDGELEAAVPGCPGWDVRALAWHLGEIHRWVRGAIVEGHLDITTPEGPSDRDTLVEWYDQGATDLLELLSGSSPDAPCRHFGPRPHTVGFWFRRMAHEHGVHAWDARASQPIPGGSEPHVDLAVALDGIDEVVTMFFPRQVRLQRIAALQHTLGIRPTDGPGGPGGGAPGGGWLLAGDGAGPPALTSADAVVSGPAGALYLLLWGRLPLADPRLTVEGDRSAAESVLGTAIIP